MITVIALLGCAALHAHEIGTTRVSVLIEESTYKIEVATDANALIRKLAAASGSASPDAAGAAELQRLLKGFDAQFRQRVRVAFDGVNTDSAIEYSVNPAAAVIRLSGLIPRGARTFTWNYGWTFASYAFTVRNGASASSSTEWLEGSQTSAPFALNSPDSPSRFTAWRYLLLGFSHIIPKGLDHILFVLGIYLLSARVRAVLCQISAFTVAHSITLALNMYGLVALPSRFVEPMIAVSIAYVGIENIFLKDLTSWRVALVSAFGLLHGMGFAGALRDIGLPHSQFLAALLSFNLGVEAGQLVVITAAFLLFGRHCADRPWYRSRVMVPASALIACTAVYWTIQRLLA